MVRKILIGVLAVGTFAGCSEGTIVETDDTIVETTSPISGGRLTSYLCKNVADSEISDDVRASLDITARTKIKTSKTMPNFKMGSHHFKDYTLYEADISYNTHRPDPDNPGSFTKQDVFEYKNVDFKYDNQDLILMIAEDENLPACQIRFEKVSKNSRHKIGKHTCEFEKNDVGYRAATFDFACGRSGKIGIFRE